MIAALALYDVAARLVLGRWPALGSPVAPSRARARSLAVRILARLVGGAP